MVASTFSGGYEEGEKYGIETCGGDVGREEEEVDDGGGGEEEGHEEAG